MEIVRQIVNKYSHYSDTYKLIKIDDVFYWKLTQYAKAPTLHLDIDRNTNKELKFIFGRLLFFKEEDLSEDTTTNN